MNGIMSTAHSSQHDRMGVFLKSKTQPTISNLKPASGADLFLSDLLQPDHFSSSQDEEYLSMAILTSWLRVLTPALTNNS